MININTQLNIKHDANGTFSDYDQQMVNYGKDSVTLTVANATDYVYIGYEKPINAVYVDIITPNGVAGTSTLEFYNGSSWVSLANSSDDTQGLFRSGFIKWDREQDNQVANTVDSKEAFWYRIKPSVDRTGIVVSGINLIFSDDYELSLENPLINNVEFLGDESNHIKYHVATKREIIQKFRNQNYIKYNSVTGDKEDINCWDLLDAEEVKLAATYLTLAKIYFAVSDNPEDIWAEKNKQYKGKFDKYIQLARLSLDTDDDGLVSSGENKPEMKNRHMHR